MSTGRSPFARRITAGLGIAALATAALLGSVLPANATDATPGPGNINPATPKSLTIHKYAQPSTLGTAPDGTELPASTTRGLGDGLDGVTFQIQKVTTIDLNTYQGWQKTEGLTPEKVPASSLDAPVSGVTANGGTLTFPDLAQAVYLVTETDPGTNNIAFKAQPFLVALPLPNKSENTWIYDVHVYPKNSLTTLEKQVDDSTATGLGSNVTWTITAEVPNNSEGNTLTSFAISDKLDPRLSYKSVVPTLVPATADLVAADYTVDTTSTPDTVRIDFTASGLAKLAPGSHVSVALVTEVTSLGSDGDIKNTAESFINDNKFTSNTVETVWGNLVIHKVSAQDEKLTLKDAEFQVYATEADAKAGSNAIKVNGVDTFTTGADGNVTIAGLRALANGTGPAIQYWLVETKAPVGYEIAGNVTAANPLPFTVKAGKVSTTVDINVADPQTPPFTLPLTGGPGTAAIMMAGMGLLAIAGGVALYRRSRRTVQP